MTEAEGRLRRVHVRITGRVQGVAYRHSTRSEARALGLAGWVRNLPDGDVEAVFQGPADDVDRMLSWCRKGPPLARVREVRENEEPAVPDAPQTFEIRF